MFSNPEKNLIQLGISEGMVIADFGVGNGFYAKVMARKVGESGKVYCIDIQNEMLHKLSMESEQEEIYNLEFVWSDVEKSKGSTLKSDSVDLVLIANTFFQIENKSNVAEEAYRIVHTKGRVCIIEWADSFAGMGPHSDHVVPKEAAKDIFVKAGFIFDREIDAGDHHYGLVFRK
jgi:ubiquinone/menaquinone biosynthesis C-methylase UbiE